MLLASLFVSLLCSVLHHMICIIIKNGDFDFFFEDINVENVLRRTVVDSELK